MGHRLVVLGAGSVGQGVLRQAAAHGHTVTAVADSSSAALDDGGIDVERVLERKRVDGILGEDDPSVVLETDFDVLVEATPTTLGAAEPAFSHLRTTLERDRHVVMANKGPIAERYPEVRALARASEGELRFEATVGGAIPVLSVMKDYGAAEITAARGVLNGTANFILTRMSAEGLGFEHVLAEAQDLGVAEADPTFDIDGTDAALKCVILANVLTDGDPAFTLADADVEGIADIPGMAIELAAEDGRTVRLIGEATRDGVTVSPRLVPEHGILAVTGTTNIVQLTTREAGGLNLSGRGAGGPETAAAVLADVNRLQPVS